MELMRSLLDTDTDTMPQNTHTTQQTTNNIKRGRQNTTHPLLQLCQRQRSNTNKPTTTITHYKHSTASKMTCVSFFSSSLVTIYARSIPQQQQQQQQLWCELATPLTNSSI